MKVVYYQHGVCPSPQHLPTPLVIVLVFMVSESKLSQLEMKSVCWSVPCELDVLFIPAVVFSDPRDNVKDMANEQF